MKKLTLKKVNVNESMSEETLCFSADVYEDGKLVAHASNRGHGGETEMRPANGLTHKDIAHLENLDTECEIMHLAQNYSLVKKLQTNALVIEKGDEIYTIKFKASFAKIKKAMHDYDGWIKGIVAKHEADGYKILNTNL